LSGALESGAKGAKLRWWISLLLFVGGCLCFTLMHAMPMTSYASGMWTETDWVTDYGWNTWPDIVDAVRWLPDQIRAGRIDAETWMMVATIAGFAMGGILSLAAPLLFPSFRLGRLLRWVVLIGVVMAWLSGPGLILVNGLFDPHDPESFRWEFGIYVWMASGILTMLGLLLLPAAERGMRAT